MPIIPPPTIRVTLDPGALSLVRGGTGRLLKRITPQVAQRDHAILSQVATVFHINTPERLAHWFGQIVYESAGGGIFTEGVSDRHGSSSRGSRYRGQGWAQVSGSARSRGGPLVLPGNFASYERYLASRDRADYELAPPAPVVRTPGLLATHPYNCHSAGWYMGPGAFGAADWDRALRRADEGVTLELVMWMTRSAWRPAADQVRLTGPVRHEIAQSALRAFRSGGARFEPCSGASCLGGQASPTRPGTTGFRFRRMSMGGGVLPGLALIASSNVFTQPKAWLGAANVPDVADYLSRASGEPVDLTWAPQQKSFGYDKSGGYQPKSGAYTPAPSHIPELP